MANILLSYLSEDEPLAHALAEQMVALEPDVHRISPFLAQPTTWRKDLYHELQLTDVHVFLITKAASASALILAQAQVTATFSAQSGGIALLPVLFQGASLPLQLFSFGSLEVNEPVTEAASAILREVDRLFQRTEAYREERRQQVAVVQGKAAKYIEPVLGTLARQGAVYRRVAHVWYGFGFFCLVVSICFVIYRIWAPSPPATSWIGITPFLAENILLVFLLISAAKFSAILGKAYMIESLRQSNRHHAIMFGKFFLESFGENLSSQDTRAVFEHWNIDLGSGFLQQSATDFDPAATELASALTKLLKTSSQ